MPFTVSALAKLGALVLANLEELRASMEWFGIHVRF